MTEIRRDFLREVEEGWDPVNEQLHLPDTALAATGWTEPTNYTERRTLDGSTATPAEVMDLMCTLVHDLMSHCPSKILKS